MKHTILLTPSSVPNNLGRYLVENYLYSKIPSFVSGRQLHNDILTHEAIDEIFSGTSDGIETVELVVNPYNRVFLYYVHHYLGLTNPTVEAVAYAADIESFAEALTAATPDMEGRFFTNLSEHRDPEKATYIVRAEHIEEDLLAIPEVTSIEDLFDKNSPMFNTMYREYYTDDLKALVAEKLDKDLTAYGYTF
jgi:hypothetical protein